MALVSRISRDDVVRYYCERIPITINPAGGLFSRIVSDDTVSDGRRGVPVAADPSGTMRGGIAANGAINDSRRAPIAANPTASGGGIATYSAIDYCRVGVSAIDPAATCCATWCHACRIPADCTIDDCRGGVTAVDPAAPAASFIITDDTVSDGRRGVQVAADPSTIIGLTIANRKSIEHCR